MRRKLIHVVDSPVVLIQLRPAWQFCEHRPNIGKCLSCKIIPPFTMVTIENIKGRPLVIYYYTLPTDQTIHNRIPLNFAAISCSVVGVPENGEGKVVIH